MTPLHRKLRKRLYEQAGISDVREIPTVDELYRMQWNAEFEKLMRNRLAMGALRYGFLSEQIGRCKTDNITQIQMRLDNYVKTKNAECLIDIANFALVEFTVNKPILKAKDR